MSIETALPYSWLRSISPDVLSSDKTPLWGFPPPFPWELFSEQIKALLKLQEIHILPENTEWRSKEALLSGQGSDPYILSFNVVPLEGLAFWIMPRESLKELLQLTLGTEIDLTSMKKEWLEEFYEFLALDAIVAFQHIKYDPSLFPEIKQDPSLPETLFLTIDIRINTPSKQLTSRLALTANLRQSIQKKYTNKSLSYPTRLAEALTVTVQIIAGNVSLSRDEWQSVNPGDYVVLDSCSLSPNEDKGRIILMVNESPLFRGKIIDGNIKILEYPLLQEVHAPMAKQEDFDEDEEFTEEEFDVDEETQTELGDEEHTEEEPTETDEEHTSGTTESEHSQDDEDEFTSEESVTEEAMTHAEEESDEEPKASAEKEGSKPASIEKSAPSLSHPEDIPLTISIEVGRLQMSVKQLLEMSPGNVLELNVHPENGVDLVINNRCIGKGELLKIGDALGVRILEKA